MLLMDLGIGAFSWGELGAVFGIIAGVTAGANAWLNVQVRNYITQATEDLRNYTDQARDEVLQQIKSEYPLKEVTELRLASLQQQTDLHLGDLQRRVLLLEAEQRARRAPGGRSSDRATDRGEG